MILGVVKDGFAALDLPDPASDLRLPRRAQLHRLEAAAQRANQLLTLLLREGKGFIQDTLGCCGHEHSLRGPVKLASEF